MTEIYLGSFLENVFPPKGWPKNSPKWGVCVVVHGFGLKKSHAETIRLCRQQCPQHPVQHKVHV